MHNSYKVALIDQKENIGGGQRFTKQLLFNFAKYHKNIEIDYYGSPNSIKKISLDESTLNNVKIKKLKSLYLKENGIFKIKNSNKIIKQLQNRYAKLLEYLPPVISGNLKRELEAKLKIYDVVFFLWPYLVDIPDINNKKVVVIHDLMFKYHFGSHGSFNSNEIEKISNQLNIWIKNSDVIVTSNFMKSEIKKFYPKVNLKKIHVIRLGPLTEFTGNITKKNILKKYNIKNKYIICPTVVKPHKNIHNLIKAFYVVKKKFKNIHLVFCGAGTDIINGLIEKDKIEFNKIKKDVHGLGFVEDTELDYLIKNSELTINQSLYDAGNGSGLDAWLIGSPVAMSNIPPYMEHLRYLNVKAEVFDPNNCLSISNKIIKILKMNKFQKEKMIYTSKKNINKVSWKTVVNNYYNLIIKIL